MGLSARQNSTICRLDFNVYPQHAIVIASTVTRWTRRGMNMSGKTSGGKLVRFGVVILIAVVGGWFVMSRIFSSSDHADEAPTQTTLAEESGAAEPQSTASSSPQGPAPANASSGGATGSELPEFGTAIGTVDSPAAQMAMLLPSSVRTCLPPTYCNRDREATSRRRSRKL